MKTLQEIIKNDYFKLFVKREGKVVLGKRYASLWLLCSVLTATFLAIAFSNASLDYLAYKMNDPFVNWVDIQYQSSGDFVHFKEELDSETLKQQYHFNGYQADKYYYWMYFTANNDSTGLKVRYFAEIQTPLVQAILDKENVVDGCRIADEKLDDLSFGVIITQEALRNKLGYKGEIPTYIYPMVTCDPLAGVDYGVEILSEHYAKSPVPVLAVVQRLPGNMDIIATKYHYNQSILAQSLSMDNAGYHGSFIYFVPEKVDSESFTKELEEVTKSLTDATYYPNAHDKLPRMANYQAGNFASLRFDYEDQVDFAVNKQIHEQMMAKYGDKGVVRVYDYDEEETMDDTDDFISIYFADLNEIRPFAEYVKEQYKIVIEMSQVTAKENFNEVSIMANFLSWTMIVFAIICILLFIINLLQSYFQKVKRNLGTFKAFGLSNYELITIYVLIMIATIFAAVVISLLVTLFIQELLPLLGIVKDGSFGYLSLGSSKTFYSVLIIIVASVYTVYEVMHNLLKATPGDLIYDR